MFGRNWVQTGGMDDAKPAEGSDEEGFTPVGDAVCWLERVCEECGALIEAELPAVCWRCGATVVAG